MKAIRHLRAAVFVVLIAAGARAAPPVDGYVEYEGTAYLHGTTQFAYGEHHFLSYRQGRLAQRVVLYTCADQSAFARKTVDYSSPMAPDFLLEDAVTGMREGVREERGQRAMFFRANHHEAERSALLPAAPELVVDAGFDTFILDNWPKLVPHGRVPMKFLVPSRREAMSFAVEHLRSEQVAGEDCEVFRLKLAGVLGWIMSGIEVAYSKEQHVLLRYEGLSDLRDAQGNNMSADILFDPKGRRPSTEEASRRARRAPLATCRTS